MSENDADNRAAPETISRPFLWLIDSEQGHLAACASAFENWAETRLSVWNGEKPDWSQPPGAVFFSAEIPGGANGDFFTELVGNAGATPLIAVARLRSLAQALAYFRAGAADYLALPVTAEDARECFAAALERTARLAAQHMILEVEQPEAPEAEPEPEPEEEDILAQVPPPEPAEPEQPESPDPEPGQPDRPIVWIDSSTFVNTMPLPLALPNKEPAKESEEPAAPGEEDFDVPEDLLFADTSPDTPGTSPDDDPVAVDGLPVPALWEELPCGLLLFDSLGNLVFSNNLGLELLGRETLAELQDALENDLASFAAHGENHRPLPDNQWPHLLAVKTRTPRAATVSVEKRDGRRAWLRIDCQPHLADGTVARLSMTVVNLTGILPPLRTRGDGEGTGETAVARPPAPPRKEKKDKSKHRGRKKG